MAANTNTNPPAPSRQFWKRGDAMTFRARLADWISGGALSFWQRAAIDEERNREILDVEYGELVMVLRRIAACETPVANATVRRMARIAREALE